MGFNIDTRSGETVDDEMKATNNRHRQRLDSCGSFDGAIGSLAAVGSAAAAKTTVDAKEERMRMTKTERTTGGSSINLKHL